ncbi:MAG: carbohydrate kinase [Clostridium sp.]|nr:carbohydrate kinase [Clostridium sp.]
MIAKVVLGTMQNAKRIVSIAETIPHDVELCCGRYVVDAKSMLGVLSMPEFETAEMHIHTDNRKECDKILSQLLEAELLIDTGDSVKKSIYDITAFGEILIDFTSQGKNEDGQMLYARNPGGAPANVAVAACRLGAETAFIGKAGDDMHGRFLRSVLQREHVNTNGLILDNDYFTTLAFVDINEKGERNFSFARKPGADTKIQKEEIDIDILDNTNIFHVGSLSLTEQPARDTTFYAVNRAKSKGSLISYDPNYRASLWKDENTAKQYMRSLIPYVDLMKISEEETELLTDYKSVPEAAAELYHQGVTIVVITLGANGAYVYGKDGGSFVSGFDVLHVGDTNGAGDSFWGGFLYQVSKTEKRPDELTQKELEEFAGFGNAVASLCVEKRGAIPAMPCLDAVKERLQNKN